MVGSSVPASDFLQDNGRALVSPSVWLIHAGDLSPGDSPEWAAEVAFKAARFRPVAWQNAKLRGSIGEVSNYSNFSDQSSVKILSE